MFLNRRTLKTFVTLAKQVLNLKPRDSGPVVGFSELGDSFLMTANHDGFWLQYRELGEFDFSRCSLPWHGLQELTQINADDLTLTMEREQNCVEWETDGVVHTEQYPDGPSDDVSVFPTVDRWTSQPAHLLEALKRASQTVSQDSTRYALHCLLLRGKSGDLVATDSRQLLIQHGFDWPWTEELMMPASRCFRSATLRQSAELYGIKVGLSEQHIVLQFGPWAVGFPIVTEGRFPSVDLIVPATQQALTTLELDEADREWLAERLPRSSTANHKQIATLELNGAVAVRCAERDQSPEQEWILSRSQREGPETCVATDAGYLARVHHLGLSRIEVGDEKTPFVARDSQQTYLWMGLSGQPTPRPKNIPQLASPTRGPGRTPVPATTSEEQPMTKSSTNDKNTADDTSELDQLIDQATAIKGQLKDLQSDLQTLITALRAQKKQARLVRNTIDSLEKLKTLQV